MYLYLWMYLYLYLYQHLYLYLPLTWDARVSISPVPPHPQSQQTGVYCLLSPRSSPRNFRDWFQCDVSIWMKRPIYLQKTSSNRILAHCGKARRANEASACSHAEDSSHQRRRLDIVSRERTQFIPTPTTSLYAPIPSIVRTGNAEYNLLKDRFGENWNIIIIRLWEIHSYGLNKYIYDQILKKRFVPPLSFIHPFPSILLELNLQIFF